MCSLCRLPVTQNHNFGQILKFWGSCIDPLLPMRSKFSAACTRADPWCTYVPCKFRLDWFILSPSGSDRTQIFPFFGLWHFVVSPTAGSLIKLNTGTQLQTFTYPTASKLFLYSNAFMAKLGAQSLTFKSMRNRQTDKQKTQRFWQPQWRVKFEPHQTWHGDRGPRACSWTWKTFGGLTHSFASRGC